MALLQLQDVTKIYKQGDIEVHALKAVNLAVEEGEFTTVFGPSGCGKTTMLNLIGALDRPTSGKVIFADQDIGSLNKNQQAMHRRRNIGFIFQSHNLIPVLTAFENVEFALQIAADGSGNTADQVRQILEEVGLGTMLNRRPNALSGGQMQRIAVARALVKQPKLVLADEPTANLDSETSKEVLEIMVRMNRELKTTFIFSTHDPMVMDYAHRVVEIRDGEIAKDERKDE